jgi:hypothetical protein
MSLLNKISRFARSQQGRRLADRATSYARSPKGRRQIDQARARLTRRARPR